MGVFGIVDTYGLLLFKETQISTFECFSLLREKDTYFYLSSNTYLNVPF